MKLSVLTAMLVCLATASSTIATLSCGIKVGAQWRSCSGACRVNTMGQAYCGDKHGNAKTPCGLLDSTNKLTGGPIDLCQQACLLNPTTNQYGCKKGSP